MGTRSDAAVDVIDGSNENLDRLRAALDASGVVGTWDWDVARGGVLYDAGAAHLLTGDASRAGVEIYGVEAISAVHPDDRDRLVEHVRQALRRGGPMLAEYRVVAHGGTVRSLLSRGRSYHDPFGHPVRSRGIIIDITEVRADGARRMVGGAPMPDDPLEQAADIVIALKRSLGEVAPSELCMAVDLLLLSLGRAIARNVRH
jgi:hypothetical protein